MNHKQNVLIIGSGGREHVLAWKVSTSPNVSKLYVAPGNGGTSEVATNVGLKATDKRGLIRFAKDNDIGLTIVGPDDILALGMVDAFEAEGLRIFGPKRAAARIEWSKVFSKNLMTSQSIPTARYETFNDIASAKTYAASQPYPLVIKANGLALGKGVFVCADQTEADQALEELMDDKVFGDSGSSVVIEEFMKGQEVSIQALCDGKTSVLLPTSQDHKRIGTGDVGPNTGGMGTYAPVPWVKPDMLGRIKETVVESALRGLSATGSPFKGLLYPGLMIDGADIKVVEFNSRFGDPEPQSYLRLLETDLLEVLNACVDGTLSQAKLGWSNQSAVCVVLASGGYPGSYLTGLEITGVEKAASRPDVVIFHAGTKREGNKLLTAGGRVLNVTATGKDLADARDKAYAAISHIRFDGMQFRTDIGAKAL